MGFYCICNMAKCIEKVHPHREGSPTPDGILPMNAEGCFLQRLAELLLGELSEVESFNGS